MTEEPIIPPNITPVTGETFSSSIVIGKLAEALAKAQGAIHGAKKDANNPFFHSKYADLASVWEACREPLSKNGLAIIQLPGSTEAGMFVDTILTHSTGEWISSRLFMTPVQDSPQGIGSAITYARRYGLQAMVGIAPEDDDGNAASNPKAIETRQQLREDAAQRVGTEQPRSSRGGKKKQAVEPPADGKDDIPMFNGPNHEELARRLTDAAVMEEAFMETMRKEGRFPDSAKHFKMMSEATAIGLITDWDAVKAVIEKPKS